MNRGSSVAMATRASVVALAAVWSGGVLAQTADAPSRPAGPSGVSEQRGFEEIIVTARRRSERLQDVPVSATAFSSEDLARYDTSSLQQIATRTPQLSVSPVAVVGGGVLTLRGIGSPVTGTTIEQAVSVAIDGVQFNQANVLKLGFHDLERIEVLKGPQTLFYGKSSTAGVISIVSANPTDRFEGSVRAGYEIAHERKYVEGIVSAPVTDTLGVRLDAYFSKQNGWFRNDAEPIPAVVVPASFGGQGESTAPGVGTASPTGPNVRDVFVRGTVVFKAPDGAFDANLKMSYSDSYQRNGLNAGTQIFLCPAGAPQLVLALGSAGSRDCKLDRYYNESDIPSVTQALDPVLSGGRQFIKSRQFLTALTMNFNLSDEIALTSVTGYYDFDQHIMANPTYGSMNASQASFKVAIKQFSQELRLLSSFGSPFNFMVGAYYQYQDNFNNTVIAFNAPFSRLFTGGVFTGPILATKSDQTQHTNAYSVFGQAILDITDQLQLTAGGRYSTERKTVEALNLPNAFLPNTFEVPITPDRRTFHNFSPDVTLTYKPVPTLTFYGAYRHGFQSGGFDLNSTTLLGRPAVGDITFDQTTVRGGEIGAKGSLAGGQVSFDLTLYNYKYKGLQVSAFDSTTLGFRVTNAGSAITRGIELAAQFRPRAIEGLTLRTSISYNDAHYVSFTNSPCYTGQSVAAGCAFRAGRDASGRLVVRPIEAGEVGNVQDLSGRRLGMTSPWAGNIGGTFERPIGSGLILSLSADGIYTGSYMADVNQDPRAGQDSAWRLNANIALRDEADRWELALLGTNLTQVMRASYAFRPLLSGSGTGTPNAVMGDLAGVPSDPRTVTLQATYRF